VAQKLPALLNKKALNIQSENKAPDAVSVVKPRWCRQRWGLEWQGLSPEVRDVLGAGGPLASRWFVRALQCLLSEVMLETMRLTKER